MIKNLPVQHSENLKKGDISQLSLSNKNVDNLKTNIFGDIIKTEVMSHGVNSPWAVFCPGFIEDEKNRDIAYELFNKGISTAVIKYRGVEDSAGTFKFKGALYDIRRVITDLKEHYILKEERMALVGYSYGGLFSLNICSKNPKIKNLVCISPIVNLENFLNEGKIEKILKDGETKVRGNQAQWQYEQLELKAFNNPTEKQIINGIDRHSDIVWSDGIERSTYIGKTMIERLGLDTLLVVHGSCDKDVPSSHSQELFNNCSTLKKKLEIIPGADHGYIKNRKKLINVVSDHILEVLN